MPVPEQIEKAKLRGITWNKQGVVEQESAPFDVQFNPQSLKVNYANQRAGGDQAKGGPIQFVGKGTTKLSLELWFDTSVEELSGGQPKDVRGKTARVANFMVPKKAKGKKDQFIPPGLQFMWGSFLFDGVMDSMDENLEYFSASGVPLRASVSISISKQEITVRPPENDVAGTQALAQAKAGESVQGKTADSGTDKDWKDVAAANGIENPRDLAPGMLLAIGGGSAHASLGLNVSAGATFGVSASASLGLSGGASSGGGASFGGGISFGGGASLGADGASLLGGSLGASGSAGALGGATAGVGLGVTASASASAGAEVR